MEITFISWGGYLNIFAGLALITYWYSFAIFLPYRQLSDSLSILVKDPNWTWINWLGVAGALAGLMGQASILLFQLDSINWLAALGFYLAVLGTTMLIGTMLWETILWPILVSHDESLLSFTGSIYSSRTFMPFFIISGLIYALGYVFVGIAIIQNGMLPSATGFLLAIGAPTFALGSLFGKFQVYPRSIGVTLMSVALIWLGIVLV